MVPDMPPSFATRPIIRRLGLWTAAAVLAMTTPASGQPPDMHEAPAHGRAVLYEEDLNDPTGRRALGTVEWKLVTTPTKRGAAVQGNVRMPGRPMTMSILIYGNDDPWINASHIVVLTFQPPPDVGAVEQAPGILLKRHEAARGEPLIASSIKLADNQFAIRLSNAPAAVARNMELLGDRSWIDVPIVFGNRKRAIVAVEKGLPGIKAFGDMLSAKPQPAVPPGSSSHPEPSGPAAPEMY